jgi:hypothetical protein
VSTLSILSKVLKTKSQRIEIQMLKASKQFNNKPNQHLEGDTNKSRKYMSKNIRCNILVVE